MWGCQPSGTEPVPPRATVDVGLRSSCEHLRWQGAQRPELGERPARRCNPRGRCSRPGRSRCRARSPRTSPGSTTPPLAGEHPRSRESPAFPSPGRGRPQGTRNSPRRGCRRRGRSRGSRCRNSCDNKLQALRRRRRGLRHGVGDVLGRLCRCRRERSRRSASRPAAAWGGPP